MDKEIYKQKLHTLVENLKRTSDKELWGYFVKEMGATSFNAKIDDIYELCIENVIRKQAEEFYGNFPIEEIKQDLINDYIRMESFRRKDNFEDFCLALYQQIECMTNKLCTNRDLCDIAEKMWSCSPYIVINEGVEPCISNRMEVRNGFCIAKFILIDTSRKRYFDKCSTSLQNQGAIDKIRIVVYYLGYHAMMKSSQYENYLDIVNSFNDIYQCRNLNHRGANHNEYEQKILDRVLPQKSYYYFKFFGCLAQYVNYIREGLEILPQINEYAKTITPQKILAEPKVVAKIDLPEDGKKRFK